MLEIDCQVQNEGLVQRVAPGKRKHDQTLKFRRRNTKGITNSRRASRRSGDKLFRSPWAPFK